MYRDKWLLRPNYVTYHDDIRDLTWCVKTEDTSDELSEETVADVFGTLTVKQKNAVYAILGQTIEKRNDKPNNKPLNIKKAIFNNPATIVIWSDGTKSVVKCGENDVYDPEKGLAMCIAKKFLGNNTGRYYETFKKWIPLSDTDTADDVAVSLDQIWDKTKTNFDKCLFALFKREDL